MKVNLIFTAKSKTLAIHVKSCTADLNFCMMLFAGNIQDSCQRFHFMPRFVHRSSSESTTKLSFFSLFVLKSDIADYMYMTF